MDNNQYDLNKPDTGDSSDNGAAPPDNDAAPPDNDATPPDNDATPPDNDAAPPDNDSTPTDNGVTPTDYDVTPPDNDATPPDNGTTPDNDATPPANDVTPPDNDATPPDNGTTPDNDTTPPDNYAEPDTSATPPDTGVMPVASEAIFLPKFCPTLNKIGKICVLAVVILICITALVVIILGAIKYASTRIGCLSYTAIKNKCCPYGVAEGGGCNIGKCSHNSRRTRNGKCCGKNGVASNTNYCNTIEPKKCKQLLNCFSGTCQPFSNEGKCCLYGITKDGNACYPSACKTTAQGGLIGRTDTYGHCTCKYGKAKNGKTKYNGGCNQKCTVDMGDNLEVSYNGVCCKSGLARGVVKTITDANGDKKTTLVQYCIQRDCPNLNAVTAAGKCCTASQKLIFEYGDDNNTITRCDSYPHGYIPTSHVISKRGRYCKYGVAKIGLTCNSNAGKYSRANDNFNSKSFAYGGAYCKYGVAAHTMHCNEPTDGGGKCDSSKLTQNGMCCPNGVTSYYNDDLYKNVPFACKTTLCDSPNVLVHTPDGKQCCKYGANNANTECAPSCSDVSKYTLKKNRCCKYGVTTIHKTRCNAPCTTKGKGMKANADIKSFTATNVLTAAGYCCANGIAINFTQQHQKKIPNVLCNQTGTFEAFTLSGKGCKYGLAVSSNGELQPGNCKIKCENPTKSINTKHGACMECKYGFTQAYFRTVKKSNGNKTVSTQTVGVDGKAGISFPIPKTKGGKTLCIAGKAGCVNGGLYSKKTKDTVRRYTENNINYIIPKTFPTTYYVTDNYKDLVLKGKKCNNECGLYYENTAEGNCTHSAVYNQTRQGRLCDRGYAICGMKGDGCFGFSLQGDADVIGADGVAIYFDAGQACASNYATEYCNHCYKNTNECLHSKRGGFCGYSIFMGCQGLLADGTCLAGGSYPSRYGVTNFAKKQPVCINTVTQFTRVVSSIKSCVTCPYGVTAKDKSHCNTYCGCGVKHTDQGQCTSPEKKGQKVTGACCPNTGSAVCSKGKKCTAKFNAANNGTGCIYATSQCNNCFKPSSKCSLTRANGKFCGNTQSGACVPLTTQKYDCSDPQTAGLVKYKNIYFPSISFRYTQKGNANDDNQ